MKLSHTRNNTSWLRLPSYFRLRSVHLLGDTLHLSGDRHCLFLPPLNVPRGRGTGLIYVFLLGDTSLMWHPTASPNKQPLMKLSRTRQTAFDKRPTHDHLLPHRATPYWYPQHTAPDETFTFQTQSLFPKANCIKRKLGAAVLARRASSILIKKRYLSISIFKYHNIIHQYVHDYIFVCLYFIIVFSVSLYEIIK